MSFKNKALSETEIISRNKNVLHKSGWSKRIICVFLLIRFLKFTNPEEKRGLDNHTRLHVNEKSINSES